MQEFSTSNIKAKERFCFWHSLIAERDTSMSLRCEAREEFQGRIRLLQFCGISYSFYQCSPSWVLRDKKHILADSEQNFFLYLPFDGHINLEHNGSFYTINSGDCALIDGEFPLRSCQSSRNVLSLRIPKAMLPLAETGRISILSDKTAPADLHSMQRFLLSIPLIEKHHEPSALAQRCCDMLSEVFSPLRLESRLELIYDRSYQQILNTIKQKHRERLNVADICSSIGISDSSLYKIMKRNQSSFRNLLSEHRLQSALAEISQNPSQPILHSAVNSGFDDSSHFARTFKRRFGISASEFRSHFCFKTD